MNRFLSFMLLLSLTASLQAGDPTDNDDADSLLDTIREIQSLDREQALSSARDLIKQYPHSRLGHMLYADLLLARAEPLTEIDSGTEPETLLIDRLRSWAQAWSQQDFAAYTDVYSAEYRARFESHAQWLAQRRQRIMRAGAISIEVSDIQISWRGKDRAVIDFEQAFDSARYSDRVVKRLRFSRIDSQWKITDERVLSVL